MSTFTKNLLQNTQTNSPTTLVTSTATNVIDGAKDAVNNLSTVHKMLIAGGIGAFVIILIAGIVYCWKRRTVTIRPGQRVQMAYEMDNRSRRR